jgi:hypothetical protein
MSKIIKAEQSVPTKSSAPIDAERKALHTTQKEAAQVMADRLSVERGVEVHPLAFYDNDNPDRLIIGFIEEPRRMVKIALMNKSPVYPFSAACEMYDVIVIKEHSDPRLWSEDPKFDSLYMGAANEAYNLVKMKLNLIDKKK